MARVNPVSAAGLEALYPFASHRLDLKGLSCHYVDEGRGEPVVMLHGNPTWSFYYRNLVKALSPRFRTIVPDHIGCGLSDKPPRDAYDYTLSRRVADLDALIRHLNLSEPINLVVHDWGGMIGMAWAVRHPERVRRLVITNTAAFLPPRQKGLPWRLWLMRHLSPLATPAVLGLNLFARAALWMAVARPLPKKVKKGLLLPYDRPRNRVATLAFVQDIPTRPSDPAWPVVTETTAGLYRLAHLPMLICWGMRDFVFDADYLAEWRRRFPEAEVHEFAGAGHYLLEDAFEGVARRVEDFLKKRPK